MINNKSISFRKKIVFLFLIQLCFLSSNFGISFASAQEPNTEASKLKIERHFVFDTISLDLEEIASASDRIFAGKCIKIEEIENDSEADLPVVKYTFSITEGLKGIGEKQEISFKQWQPTVRSAGYELNKKYVLFLHPNSNLGLTSPVGFAQGQFHIKKKGFIVGKDVVINGLNNHGLTRNLKTQKKISVEGDEFINDYVNRCSELGIPIRYQEFVKAVKYLVEKK